MKNYGNSQEYYDSAFDDVVKKANTMLPRCYTTHQGLKIGEYTVYGGSCSSPIVKDADVYVGLDYSMNTTPASFPWNGTTVEFLYAITDMKAPSDPKEFKKLIGWLVEQIEAGKKVHIGCIGGHGRTGTVLSALVKVMTGNEDAITYVREHYCERAVETDSQINFLFKHFGIKKVKGTKEDWFGKGKGKGTALGHYVGNQASLDKQSLNSVFPVASEKSIWLEPVKAVKV